MVNHAVEGQSSGGGAEDAPVHGPVGVDLFCEFGTEEVPGDGIQLTRS
jgi:hypothetical protein